MLGVGHVLPEYIGSWLPGTLLDRLVNTLWECVRDRLPDRLGEWLTMRAGDPLPGRAVTVYAARMRPHGDHSGLRLNLAGALVIVLAGAAGVVAWLAF